MKLWDRITGKAEREAYESGWNSCAIIAISAVDRYAARHDDIRRAALEVCADILRDELANGPRWLDSALMKRTAD